MNNPSHPLCLILAGGQGKRFGGVNKCMLLYDGTPILDRQLVEIQKATNEVAISSTWLLPDKYQTIRVVADKIGGQGPMDGIVGAMESINNDWFWVVACDMPNISKAAFDVLWSRRSSELHFVVPRISGRVQPLFGLFHRNALRPMMEHLSAGKLSLSKFCLSYEGDFRAVFVDENEFFHLGLEFLKNCNTEKDLL